MAQTKMARKRRGKKAAPRRAGALSLDNGRTATRQFVVTLDVPKRGIVKVEKLEKSGGRQNASDEDFALLIGEDEQDLGDVLEEAYSAGVHDAMSDDIDGADDGAQDEDLAEMHHGIRLIILRRALKRGLVRRKVVGRAAETRRN